jgi:hypothetical protein
MTHYLSYDQVTSLPGDTPHQLNRTTIDPRFRNLQSQVDLNQIAGYSATGEIIEKGQTSIYHEAKMLQPSVKNMQQQNPLPFNASKDESLNLTIGRIKTLISKPNQRQNQTGHAGGEAKHMWSDTTPLPQRLDRPCQKCGCPWLKRVGQINLCIQCGEKK